MKPIFYLQIRKDPETRVEEFSEFIRFSGLPETSFKVVNVFEEPYFDYTSLDKCSALFIGGSSDDPDDTVYMDPSMYPYITNTQQLLVRAYETMKPTFLSCIGFQIGCEALGGEVILDKPNMEIGTYDITLTDEAMKDPLFTDIPRVFHAVSGHKKRASRLPTGATHLAHTPLCPYHAFTFPDRPFYAFQFHPEIDTHDLSERLKRYKDRGYFDAAELETLLESIQDTSIANKLVKNFVDYVL